MSWRLQVPLRHFCRSLYSFEQLRDVSLGLGWNCVWHSLNFSHRGRPSLRVFLSSTWSLPNVFLSLETNGMFNLAVRMLGFLWRCFTSWRLFEDSLLWCSQISFWWRLNVLLRHFRRDYNWARVHIFYCSSWVRYTFTFIVTTIFLLFVSLDAIIYPASRFNKLSILAFDLLKLGYFHVDA